MKLKTINIFIFLFFVTIIDVGATGIEIDSVDSKIQDDNYLLNSTINFEFADEVIDAINHGVSLYIDILTRIKRQRKWVWDKTVLERTYSFKLERHALSGDYIVTNITTNERQQLSTLDEALSTLGKISGLELVPSVALIHDRSYRGLIMAQLNVEKLPPPLRPIAYASEKWQLKSDWKEWDIRIINEE